jgi:hypothetical protein
VIRAVVVLLLIAGSARAQPAADFYVSPVGDDKWSGKLAAPNANKTDGPFATPARARDAARQMGKDKPRTVLLRSGRYELAEPLTFTPADSGLTLAAYPNETPVLSGGRQIKPHIDKDFTDVWLIPVPEAAHLVRHISVGGQWRRVNRRPTEGTYTIAGLAGADPKANYRTPADRFEYAAGQIEPGWVGLSQVEVTVLHFWVAGHYMIQELDAPNRVVVLDRKSIRRFTEDGGQKPGRFYLSNVPDKSARGEFYHDLLTKRVFYYSEPGEIPETYPVVVPRLASVLQLDGKPEAGEFVERVELRGLTISDSAFDGGAKAAGDLQAAQHVPGSVKLRGARQCTIADCKLTNLGGYGIELADGCRENAVIGNELGDLAAGGIRLNGGAAGSPENLRTGKNLIADNHLHHLGRVYPAGVGILSQHADQNLIRHNHVHHSYYTGISVGWVWGYATSVSTGNVVEGNLIHDIGQKVLSDMGGIYMLGVSPGTVVRNNVIHDVDSFGYGGWGIYTDEGSTGITIENNLVYRTKSGGFHQHFGKDNVVRNNIFAFAREGQLMRSRAEPHTSFTFERNVVYFRDAPLFAKNWTGDKFVVDHNLYWEAGGKPIPFPGGTLKDWQARGHDRRSLIADPLFMDPDKGDFRLKPGSPAGKVGFVPFDYSTAGVRPREKR